MSTSADSIRVSIRAIAGAGLAGPAGKQAAIVEALRRGIVGGRYALGARLPTRVELASSFDVNLQTAQAAIARLMAEGFVVARGSRGTFISDEPPHLSRFGLAMEFNPAEGDRRSINQFAWLLHGSFTRRREQAPSRFETYVNLWNPQKSEDFTTLLADIRGHRLAGLITDTPRLATNEVLIDAVRGSGVPWVAFSSGSYHYPSPLRRIVLSHESLLKKCVEECVHRRRRRIACIDSGIDPGIRDSVRDYASRLGAVIATRHWLAGDARDPRTAHPLAELLGSTATLADSSQRVDALIVGDDVLLEQVCAGLSEGHAGVPGDILVVTHCNFPHRIPCGTPVVRVGFDVDEAIDLACELIRRARAGKRVPVLTDLPLVSPQDRADPFTRVSARGGTLPIRGKS